MEDASEAPKRREQTRGFMLGSLSVGHGISHLYDQGFPVFMPTITLSLGLSTLQVAALHGLRQAGFGVVNLGGGPLVDRMKRHWGLILTGCLVWAGLAFALVGASPNFGVLIVSVMFVSVPGALWHLPSTAAISQRFPDRRGFAISMHGFGSNIGNVVGPVLAGALLGVFFWRNVFFIYTAPALILAVFVWWSLRNLGKEDDEGEPREMSARFRDALTILKSPTVSGLIVAASLINVGQFALFNWTPFYLEEDLGMGHFKAGFYYALLTGSGIISAPVLGVLSDKFGRKTVLVPGFCIATVLAMLVASAGDSVLLPLVLAGMGLFSFAMHQVIQAAVLDAVGTGTEATTIGLLFGLNGVVSGASPFLAAFIINYLGGYESIYYYAGILTAATAVVVAITPFYKQNVSVTVEQKG